MSATDSHHQDALDPGRLDQRMVIRQGVQDEAVAGRTPDDLEAAGLLGARRNEQHCQTHVVARGAHPAQRAVPAMLEIARLTEQKVPRVG